LTVPSIGGLPSIYVEFLSMRELAIVEIDQRRVLAFCNEHSDQEGGSLDVSPSKALNMIQYRTYLSIGTERATTLRW
jgi:hypothetical protein